MKATDLNTHLDVIDVESTTPPSESRVRGTPCMASLPPERQDSIDVSLADTSEGRYLIGF